MPAALPSAVRRVIDAAGGPVALSRVFGVSYQAVYQFERKGYLPLEKAKEAVTRWPEAATLRELVRDDIGAAMDMNQSSELLA